MPGAQEIAIIHVRLDDVAPATWRRLAALTTPQ